MIRSFIADSSMKNFCLSHLFVLFCFVFCLFVCLFDLLGLFVFLKHFFIQCWKYKLADA